MLFYIINAYITVQCSRQIIDEKIIGNYKLINPSINQVQQKFYQQGMIQQVQPLMNGAKIPQAQEQSNGNYGQCSEESGLDKKTTQHQQNIQLTYNKSISAELTNNQLTSNQVTQQTNYETGRVNRYSIYQKSDSSDQGDISGRIQNVKEDKKKIICDERQSNVYFQDVLLVKKPENKSCNIVDIQEKYIKQQVNFQQSIMFEKPQDRVSKQVKERQTLRGGSIRQLRHLMPQYSNNIKNLQQSKQNNQNLNKNQFTCYLQLFQSKWEKVDLKITKNKVNIGPVTIDVSKILKIKIFPSELTQESQENIKSSGFDENQIKKKNAEKEKQKAKVQKPMNKIDKFFKKKLFGQESKSNSSQKIQQDDNPAQDTILKIYKKNLLKLTTQNNNIYQFYQIYPTILLGQPKQTYSFSTFPQPQTPNIGLSSRLPAPFISLSRIILKKLKQLYPHIKSTIWEQPSFPIRTIIHSDRQFNNSLLSKAKGTKNYAHIHGIIYKKSQIKGKWQKRYVIINQKGLFSYKQEKDEGYSFSIESKNIKYMWTWFNVLKIDKQKEQILNDQVSDKQTQKGQISNQQKKGEKSEGKKKSREPSPKQQNNKNLYQSQQKPVDPFSSIVSRADNMLGQSNQSNQNLINLQDYKNLMKTEYVDRKPEQMIDNKSFYLIIKLKHGFNGQTQFAIPVCGFDNEANKLKNWLFAFYKIISRYQY